MGGAGRWVGVGVVRQEGVDETVSIMNNQRRRAGGSERARAGGRARI